QESFFRDAGHHSSYGVLVPGKGAGKRADVAHLQRFTGHDMVEVMIHPAGRVRITRVMSQGSVQNLHRVFLAGDMVDPSPPRYAWQKPTATRVERQLREPLLHPKPGMRRLLVGGTQQGPPLEAAVQI